MMTKIVILLSSLLTSCAFIGPSERNVHLNSAVIYGVTKSTTTLALKTIYKNLNERINAAGNLMFKMDTYALPILSNPQVLIDTKAERLLFNKIPTQYRFYLKLAFESLNNYYVSPTKDKFLSSEHVQYLRSFFSGIRQAASDMLYNNNRIIDVKINIKEE